MTMNDTTLVGWKSSPDGRGTYDILLTCLVTTFLCCWTSVYPGIPAAEDSSWDAIRDKLGLACLGLLGPDFIIVLALGQKSSARRSVKKFHSAGYRDWTITHAFFADMGGFVLHAPDLTSPIPLNAEQVFYLVQSGYIEYPNTTKRDISDKNKSDGLARLITIFQVSWFIVNIIARAVQGLCVTTIELTTVSFVVILFGTAWCWKDKPSDVTTTIPLNASVTIDEIVSRAGPRVSRRYYHTPLDFISREEIAMELVWRYYNEIARKILFSPFSRRVKKVPWDRIPGDVFLRMNLDLELVGGAFVVLFGCIFLFAWNFHFPSTVEQVFWRAASVYMMTYGMVGAFWMWLSMWIFVPESRAAEGLELSLVEESLPPHLLHKWYKGLQNRWKSLKQRIRLIRHAKEEQNIRRQPTKSNVLAFFSRPQNISPDKDPRLGVPIGFLMVTSVLCFFYCVFRLFILIEDLIGLRALPPSAYDTPNWTVFMPHI